MSPGALFVAGLLFGLAHAAHCAAMCGVFALAARRPLSFVAYGLGKTCTYALLGAMAGVLGAGVHALAHPALAVLALVAGLVLVVGGYRLAFGLPRGVVVRSEARAQLTAPAGLVARSADPLLRLGEQLARLPGVALAGVGGLAHRRLPGGRFTLGALTGALPCGAVALALLQATLAGDAPRGMLFMAAFGLGTLPALAALALLAGSLGGPLGGPLGARLPAVWLRRAGGLLVMLAGVLTALRALLPAGSCCS